MKTKVICINQWRNASDGQSQRLGQLHISTSCNQLILLLIKSNSTFTSIWLHIKNTQTNTPTYRSPTKQAVCSCFNATQRNLSGKYFDSFMHELWAHETPICFWGVLHAVCAAWFPCCYVLVIFWPHILLVFTSCWNISLLFWFSFYRNKILFADDFVAIWFWAFAYFSSQMSIEKVRSAVRKGWGISVTFAGGGFPFTASNNYKTSWIYMTNTGKNNSRRLIQQETVSRFTLQTLRLTKGLLLWYEIVIFCFCGNPAQISPGKTGRTL